VAEATSWQERIRNHIAHLGAAEVLMIAVTVLGLGLRIEHALTFDGPLRGADYAVHLDGVRWMLAHHRPFDFTKDVSIQTQYQPPLWYALGALTLRLTQAERSIAWLAVAGWLVRQVLLARILQQAIFSHRWTRLLALSVNAMLPLSILTDGKLNPEGLHSTLFMLALYALWRMERELGRGQGIGLRSAVWFGVFSGLAVLTKATAGVLVLAAFIVLGWRALRLFREAGWGVTRRRFLRPAVAAGLAWCVVAGWWCGPNLVKYHHPFPHYWNTVAEVPGHEMDQKNPVLYRRPLGWALPFEWSEYMERPVIYSSTDPRPNFWAASITGVWTDFYNRGFCRLKGGGFNKHVWGADWGPPYGGPSWYMSDRCVDLARWLLRIGLFISLVSAWAVVHTAWSNIRSNGRNGSLVLPVGIGLVVFFVMLFALVFPFEDYAVLNPRYLLPAATPMAACLAIALAEGKLAATARWILQGLLALATVGVGLLVLWERFGA
jgi:hypothetical protein